MSLKDFDRTETFQIRQDIEFFEKQIGEFEASKNAASNRIHVKKSEISDANKLQDDINHSKRRVTEELNRINKEIDEIEARRKALLEQLVNIQNEQNQVVSREKEVELLHNRIFHEIKGAEKEIQRLDIEIGRFSDLRKDHFQNLSQAKADACKKYLQSINEKLKSYLEKKELSKARRQQIEHLKKVRHENNEVANLCEAREELQRVLKTMNVPMAKKPIEAELTKIETELERRFPGILAKEEPDEDAEIYEDLFYYLESPEEARIILPFAINDLEKENYNGALYRFIWSLIKELNLEEDRSHFYDNDSIGFVELKMRSDKIESLLKTGVICSLDGTGSVAFSFAPFDKEYAEALYE